MMATDGTPKDLVQQQTINSDTMQDESLQNQKQEGDSAVEKDNGHVKTQNTTAEKGEESITNQPDTNAKNDEESTTNQPDTNAKKDEESTTNQTNANAEKGEESTTNQTDTNAKKEKPPKSPLAAESSTNVEQKTADLPQDDRAGSLPLTKDGKIQNHNSENTNVNDNAPNAHPTPVGPLASSDLPPTIPPPLKLPPPSLNINANLPPPNVAGIPGNYWYVSYQLDKSVSAKNKWYGAEGRFSTFRPKLERGDHSILQMAIVNENGNEDELQTVETGWRRNSTEAGPYFFSYTTNMGYKPSKLTDPSWRQSNYYPTGWKTYQNPPTDAIKYKPGTSDFPLCWLGQADQQHDIPIRFYLDKNGWHLKANGVWLGFYPASLFTHRPNNLSEFATSIHFYGEVYDSNVPHPGKTVADMGSGEFPERGFSWSGFIRNMKVQPNPSDQSTALVNFEPNIASVASTDRYRGDPHWNSGTTWESYAYIGGPGLASFDWTPWDSIGGRFNADFAIAAISRNTDMIDLFVCGQDGLIYTAWWNVWTHWSSQAGTWRPIGGGPNNFFAPGAKLSVVARTRDNLDVFVCGNDGRVYTSWWVQGSDWSGLAGWKDIGGNNSGDFLPATEVTAVSRSPTSIDIFATNVFGVVYRSTWVSGSEWTGIHGEWESLGVPPVLLSSAALSVVSRSPDTMDVVACGDDGQGYWTTWNSSTGWSSLRNGNWELIGAGPLSGGLLLTGAFVPGTKISVVARSPTHMDAFACALDGVVYWSNYTDGVGWKKVSERWTAVGGALQPVGGTFRPGPVTAVARKQNRMDLFMCGLNGNAYTAWWEDGVGWTTPNGEWRWLGGDFLASANIAAVARTQGNLSMFVINKFANISETTWGS